jgi:hypothetical protein
LLGLQPRHIDVEIHPVDPLDRKLHIVGRGCRPRSLLSSPAPVVRLCLSQAPRPFIGPI